MRRALIPLAVGVLSLAVWWMAEDVQIREPEGGATVVAINRATEEHVAAEEPAVNGDLAEPPVLLPHEVPATPITQALQDLQVLPMPELLDAERAFAAERVDPNWARAMEAQILGEIARGTALQLVTLQVECRTTACRLQLVERDSPEKEPRIVFPSVGTGRSASDPQIAAFRDLVSRLELDPRWVASVVDGNGTPTSLAYLARRESR